MEPIVCDTSSLIKLAKANIVPCLGAMFSPVHLPDAVTAECKSDRLKAIILLPFFIPHTVKNTLPIGLGAGERGTISAALELGASFILTDDDAAIRKAGRLGLVPLRVFDIIILAKLAGHIQSARAAMDRMIAEGEGIAPDVYAETLGKCGE